MEFETQIEKILSTSKLMLNHPGQSSLGADIYSNVHNSQIDLIRRHTYTGRYKSQANSVALNAISSFVITYGTVIGQCYIAGSVTFPQYARAGDGWALDLINLIELQVAGSSSIQSLKYTGRTHFDALMAFAASAEKRNQILQCAGAAFNNTGAASTQEFVIPLVLPWSHPDLDSFFCFDTSTLKSQITLQVTWKPAYMSISGSTSHAVTLPTVFNDLYLRVANQTELANQFLLESMQMNPSLTYSIPNLYLQSFTSPITLTAGVENQITLTSMPSGMLECLLVSLVPSTWVGASDTTSNWVNPVVGVPLSTVRLLWNGQEQFRQDYQTEFDAIQCLKNDKTSSYYNVLNTNGVADAATNIYQKGQVIIIPFCNEISKVLRNRRMENVQSYAGSSLQLYFTLGANGVPYVTSPIARGATACPSAISYNLNVSYVCNSLIQVENFSCSQELD